MPTQVLGDSSEGVTPVPIPNTAVKPLSAHGTARVSVWESRSLPKLKKQMASGAILGLFAFRGKFKDAVRANTTALHPFAGVDGQIDSDSSLSIRSSLCLDCMRNC